MKWKNVQFFFTHQLASTNLPEVIESLLPDQMAGLEPAILLHSLHYSWLCVTPGVKLRWALWLDLSDDCDVWQKDEWLVSKA
jgi:hypothetical protein